MTRVAVIGGGIAGLAAAHRIVERAPGAEVVVLEAERRAGGVLRSAAVDGYVHEHAANALLAGAPDGAVALCRELGVAIEEASPAAKRRWIYVDGAMQALPAGPMELLRTRLLPARAKLGLLAEPLRRRRDYARDGDESVWDFAVRRLGPEVARVVVAPFITGIFAGDARDIGVQAAFPTLAALEAQGGILRGAAARRRQARRDGTTREPTRSMAPTGGVEALAHALVARLGARLRLGVRVGAVTPADRGVDVAIEGAGIERFDAAVLAAPAWAIAAMVPAVPELARTAAAIHYAPVAIVLLGLRRDQVRHPLDGFGVLVAAGEQPRLLGAVFESTVWSGRAPDGHVLIRCILGGTRDPRALELDDAALVELARADLGTMIGCDAAPVHTAVVRWRRGVAQYPVGHKARVDAADAIARQHRMVLAGSAWHGAAVTDCVSDARRVAEEVARWV